MTSGRDFSRHQQSIIHRYYEHHDTIMLTKLGEMVSDLYLCTNESKAQRLWEGAAKALGQFGVPESRITHVCGGRNIELLAGLVTELSSGAKPQTPAPAPAPGSPAMSATPGTSAPANPPAPGAPSAAGAIPGAGGVSAETLKSALKAFRKRLKVTKLDDESQIGSSRNPLTSGSHSQIVAIQPPAQFPREVWEELVKQGKLKSAGRGFYQLAEGV